MKPLKFMTGAVWLAGLLTVFAAPAMAQFADPLTLAASGIVIPYFGTGNNVSILELSSPAVGNPDLHFIFYDATCTRLRSAPASLTVNDVELFSAASSGGGSAVTGHDGLIAIAGQALNAIDLDPVSTALHARMYWVDVQANRFRVLEPILVDTADRVALSNWVPLRSGATFFAPQETVGGLRTTLYLICPTDSIQGAPGSAFPAFLFPVPSATTAPVFKSSYPSGSLRARIYDDDETLLRDLQFDCACLQTRALGDLDSVYATSNTYTEIETDGTFAGFTGYKALTLPSVQTLTVDFFGRLSNTNRGLLQGNTSAIGER